MNFDLRDKVVLVTGASRGIGKAIAQAFARNKAKVIINYKSNHVAAEEAFRSILPGKHALVQADINDAEEVRKMINKIVSEYERIDIVVNNAGISGHHPVEKTPYVDWQKSWQSILQTNLIGPSNVCYCAAQYMIQQGGGRIVNVSSRGAFRGEPNMPAYGASKAGLNAMSQSLAVALAPHNVFVGVVAPGFVQTEMERSVLEGSSGDTIRRQSPMGRIAKPEEVANAVLFLSSPGTEFMTGTIIDVNGASYLR
jgi:NAD(P)-dependent dehydrogenase (short-subunit alcohol dehydrogenase family)